MQYRMLVIKATFEDWGIKNTAENGGSANNSAQFLDFAPSKVSADSPARVGLHIYHYNASLLWCKIAPYMCIGSPGASEWAKT
jgi:hypothetical protein